MKIWIKFNSCSEFLKYLKITLKSSSFLYFLHFSMLYIVYSINEKCLWGNINKLFSSIISFIWALEPWNGFDLARKLLRCQMTINAIFNNSKRIHTTKLSMITMVRNLGGRFFWNTVNKWISCKVYKRRLFEKNLRPRGVGDKLKRCFLHKF